MNRRPVVLAAVLVLVVLTGSFQGFGAEGVDPPAVSGVDGVQSVNVNDGRLVEYDFDASEDAVRIPNRAGGDYQGLKLGNNSLASRNGDTAIRFDGLPGSVEVTNSSSLSTRRAVTAAFWIRPSEEQQANLLGRYGTFYFYLDGDRIHFVVMGNDTRFAEPSAQIPVDEWTHVVGTYDTRRGARLFVNGELAAAENDTSEALDPLSGKVRINMGGWLDGFRGSVDEFSLWNRSLTETEVRMLSQDRERTLVLSSRLRTAVTLLLVLGVLVATVLAHRSRD